MPIVTVDDLLSLLDGTEQPEVRRWLGQVLGETHRRNTERADRVRRYPELADKLRRLGIDPKTWNGYVPPARWHEAEREGVHSPMGRPNMRKRQTVGRAVNDSAYREVLKAIAAEAYERDVAAGLAPGEREPDLLAAFPFPLPGLKPKQRPAPGNMIGEPYPDPEPPEPEQGELETEDSWAGERERTAEFMRGPGRQ